MNECLELYHTSFIHYWRLYWLNQNPTNEIESDFIRFEMVKIPFLPSCDLDSRPIRYRILYTLLKAFYTIRNYMDTLSLITKNEELDDINTLLLSFIAIPYFIGFLLLELPTMDDRHILLTESRLYINEFVTTLSNLSPKFRINIPENRSDKVLLARQDMEVKKKINYLLSIKSKADAFDLAKGDVKSPLFPNYDDESTIRELTILILRKFMYESQSHLQSIDREFEILKFKLDKSNLESPPREIPCISDMRNRIYKNVFIPGHELPSITLAECAKIEMDMELNIGSKKKEKKCDSSNSSDDIIKSREWDNWKDDHPWGSGNKNRNIG